MALAIAIIVAIIMLLAIGITIRGMVRGETFSLLTWIYCSGEWFAILGDCLVVIGKGVGEILAALASASSD